MKKFNSRIQKMLAAFATTIVVVAGALLITFQCLDIDGLIRETNWPTTEKTAEEAAIESSHEVVTTADEGSYRTNEVLLSFSGTRTKEEIINLLAADGIQVAAVTLVSNDLDDNDVLVRLSYTGDKSPEEISSQIADKDYVSYAEPNRVSHLDEIEDTNQTVEEVIAALEEDANDAALSDGDSAGTEVSGTTTLDASQVDATSVNDQYASSKQWELTAINAYAAWDYARVEGSVVVAVIDSGVDKDHPDLVDNLVDGQYAKNTITNKTGLDAVNDDNGHGTHVSGTIAATANNSIGIAGVSYNAKILPIKAGSSSGNLDTSDVVEAIDYIISLKNEGKLNVRVVNMSFGSNWPTKSEKNAVARLVSAGILPVAAGGNDGNSLRHYPSAYDNVIGVSALEKSGSSYVVDDYSNHGSYIDIAAPGTDIYSTTYDGKYGTKSGTSMATPVVCGVAALVCAANSNLTMTEVANTLTSTATDKGTAGKDNYYGYGIVNAYAAVVKIKPQDLSNATLSYTNQFEYTGSAIKPEVTVTCDGNVVDSSRYSVTYENNVNVGTATIKVTGTTSNCVGTKTVTFEIVAKKIDAPTAKTNLTYTGKSQTGVASGTGYTLSGTYAATNAGPYTAVATLAANYAWKDGTASASRNISWSIAKATYDMSGVAFSNKSVGYTGSAQSITISGNLPAGVSVTYENNSRTVVGSQTATAKFTGDTTNYNTIANKTATLAITQSVNTVTNLTITGWIYGQTANKPSATATFGGTIAYTYASAENGSYSATVPSTAGTWWVKATSAETENYKSADAKKSFAIAKATYDMSGVSFNDKTVVYTGSPQSITITGNLPAGVSVSYENNSRTAVGSQTATAKFTGDTTNYNTIANKTATLTINSAVTPNKAVFNLSGISNPGTTIYIDGVAKTMAVSGTTGTVVLDNANAKVATLYVYNATSGDTHTIYPTHMYVWTLAGASGKEYTVTRQSSLDDILQYAGTAIRLTGNKGIRMITAVPTSVKNSLTSSSGYQGWQLEEYGTVLQFDETLAGADVLLTNTTFKNYAYKRGVADPVYAEANGLTKYTNVLVGFTNEQCAKDLSMRSYIILKNKSTGTSITIYGGTIHRSIGYVALQNKDKYNESTDAGKFIWGIIRSVYGYTYG